MYYHLLNGAQNAPNHQNPLCIKGCPAPKSAWMASKLSTILDSLQQQLLLLNELVARVLALPPANEQSWVDIGKKLQELYSDFKGNIAILELLLSRSTEAEGGHALAELDAVAHALQTSGQTFAALRAASLSASSNQAKEGTSSENITSPDTSKPVMTAELQHVRISLRAAMASLFLSLSRGAETIPPKDGSSASENPTLQAAFSLRPFGLTGTDLSLLAPHLDSQDLTTVVEGISTQVNALAKEWVQRQTATTYEIEPSVLTHFWLGNTSSLKDIRDQLALSETGDEPCVTEIPVGNYLKRFTSTRNTTAFVGSQASGKSAMINTIVGVHLITPSSMCYFSSYILLLKGCSSNFRTLSDTTPPWHIGTNVGGCHRAIPRCSRTLARIWIHPAMLSVAG